MRTLEQKDTPNNHCQWRETKNENTTHDDHNQENNGSFKHGKKDLAFDVMQQNTRSP